MSKQPHIQCGPGDTTPYVLLPGDPARIRRIAEMLDNPREVAYNREFLTMVGEYGGIGVTVTSTGCGAPSMCIALEEHVRLGARVAIRVGSCGALQPGMDCSDLVVATAAARCDGTTALYADPAFPAVADWGVTAELVDAARGTSGRVYVGPVHSHDSFYVDDYQAIRQRWSRVGLLASDMETGALFVIGRIRGVRTGSILNVVVPFEGHTDDGIARFQKGEEVTRRGERNSILAALKALHAVAVLLEGPR
ncbi:MAG: nucleoside phosphorylase [Bacillota bacterium]|nr:nucleoside phosphorylase [Bacillota bacterium]